MLVTRDGTVRRFGDDYPDTEGWSDQYLVNRDTGYVFTVRALSTVVYLAAEMTFRVRFGLRIDSENRSITEGIDLEGVSL